MPPYNVETLRRGSACLSCRRKKLKCDGLRPTCRQCNRLNKAHACEYDEKTQKSRTEKLREQLATLEFRLQELEASSPRHELSLEDIAPYTLNSTPPSCSPRSACAPPFAGVISSPISASSSWPAAFSVCSGPLQTEGLDDFDNCINFSAPCAESNAVHYGPMTTFPDGAETYLLEVFIAHRHQCWYHGSMDRFTSQSLNPKPHPALWNAIYLLACHYTQTPYYTAMEPALLIHAMDEINIALELSDRLVDIVQASSLLAIYLYNNNRAVEGYRQAFSAVRLAIGLGLHQLHPMNNHPTNTCQEPSTFAPGSPPQNETELTERIFAFWQAFVTDRCWSAFHGLPLALPDEGDPQLHITTPWPVEAGHSPWDDGWESVPLDKLMEGRSEVEMIPVHTVTLKARAAALYDVTARLKLGRKGLPDYQRAELALQSFSTLLPSLPCASDVAHWKQSSTFDLDIFTVQTMIYTCFVHLQRHDFFDARAFKAGDNVARMIGRLNDRDYQYLDPIIGACWFGVSKMFTRILANAAIIGNSAPEFPDIINTSGQGLSVLVAAMKMFGALSPLSNALAAKVEAHPSGRF